jgi:hypothetical protein
LSKNISRYAGIMKKANNREMSDDLRPEYDLSKLKGGVRGKYAKRFQQGTNLVLLSPDVAKYFPNEQSVNAALRSLVGIAKAEQRHANQPVDRFDRLTTSKTPAKSTVSTCMSPFGRCILGRGFAP